MKKIIYTMATLLMVSCTTSAPSISNFTLYEGNGVRLELASSYLCHRTFVLHNKSNKVVYATAYVHNLTDAGNNTGKYAYLTFGPVLPGASAKDLDNQLCTINRLYTVVRVRS